MLHAKELTFNWVVPTTSTQGRVLSEDFRVTTKHNTLYIGHSFMNKYYKGTDLNDVRIAFLGLQNGDDPYLVVNPNQGIPFFKFRCSKNHDARHPSPCFCNKNLTELFKLKFKAKDETLSFTLEPFQRFNGMMFYFMKLENK